MLASLGLFLAFLLVVIYPLGWLAAPRLSNFWEKLTFSLAAGLLFLALESYIIGRLNLISFLPPVILIQSVCLWAFLLRRGIHLPQRSAFTLSPAAAVFIFLSTYLNSLITFPFGQLSRTNLALPEAHFVDSTWHLALAQQLTLAVPPANPLYVDSVVHNYHYLTDLLIASIHLLTRLPIPQLYFQFIGPFFALLLAAGTYFLVRRLTASTWGGVSACIFATLTSNLYYFVPRFFPAASLKPSVMWIDYFSTRGVNHQLTFSLILYCLFLHILLTHSSRKTFLFVAPLIAGGLVLVKSHTAGLIFATLVIFSVFALLRRNLTWLKLTFITIPLAAGLLLSLTTSLPSFQLAPFWYIKTMYESPDHLDSPDWELKRQFLLSHDNFLAVSKLYVLGLLWFAVINLGPLLVGLATPFISRHQPSVSLLWLLWLVAALGFLTVHLFIYPHTAVVTLGFFYPVVFSLAILFAVFICRVFSHHTFLAVFIGIGVWVLLLPGVRFHITGFLSQTQSTAFSLSYLSALFYLKSAPPGVVLLQPQLWSGSVIPAYTGKPVYVGDDLILPGLGIDASHRRQLSIDFFSCRSSNLPSPSITYVVSTSLLSCLETHPLLVRTFSGDKITVYTRK